MTGTREAICVIRWGVEMMFRLMDLLACPICKSFPLKLLIFKKGESRKVGKPPKCEEYCGYDGKSVSELDRLHCDICAKVEIIDGMLICPSCGRWYPIEEEIPRMMPDEFREKDEELKFLKKHASAIPSEILMNGKPFHL